MKKITVIILLSITSLLFSEHINISQVDTSGLLLKQEVDLYVQVTDLNGKHITGLEADDFIINESNENSTVDTLKITGVKEGINIDFGINFLLLVDNSGSMYRTIDNKLTNSVKDRRISIAKEAIKNFINNSVSIKDSVSLASFNNEYVLHSENLKSDGLDVLDDIVMPGADNATELYLSLVNSIDLFSEKKGRKVVIVLSDGENIPYGTDGNIVQYTEVIEEFQKSGITIFAINLAGDADEKLLSISHETGGYIFDANNKNELYTVYSGIQNQIMSEYLIRYRATMLPGVKRSVSVIYGDNSPGFRTYFSSTIFGKPLKSLHLLLILLPIIAMVLIYLLWRFNFDKLNSLPNIEVLDVAPGVKVNSSTIVLDSAKTVIGGNNSADLTIMGNSDLENEHAAIVLNDIDRSYTVISNQEVLVNNQPVKEKKLESGDVINIDGTIIVFDDTVHSK